MEVFVDQDDDRLVTWDDYVGVYVLMEKIERDPERVPIEKLSVDHATEPEISGGYLLKKDWLEEDGSYFHTQHYDDALVFVDPGPQSITDSQRAWIAAYVDAFEGVLSGSGFSDPETGYAQYIDPDTFIDHHLLVEMGRNVDGFVLSTYLHKDRQGRLCMGPIWDYNGALGNADYFEAWFTAGWHTDNPEFPADNPTGYRWYERLFEDPVFVSAHAARWHELRAGPLGTQTLIADIDAAAALLTEAQLRNFERWDILGEYVWPNAEGWDQRQTHDAEVAYLKEWLTARLQWMDFALGQ